MLYFHGNAEDIGDCSAFLAPIVATIGITIYAMEYPTYGIFTDCYPWQISDQIKSNALQFHKHISKKYGLKSDEIYIFGRSIGTGGACYVASRVATPLLILISPLDNIRAVAMDFSSLGCMLKQHFNNEEEIANFFGKVLIIHGKSDEVIRYYHGSKLYQTALRRGDTGRVVLKSPIHMSHNSFNM